MAHIANNLRQQDSDEYRILTSYKFGFFMRKNLYSDRFQYIASTLRSWGVELCSGVTGGGLIHLVKHFKPMAIGSSARRSDTTCFFNISEYTAGFLPIGYFIATGRIAGAAATTGAATKLLTCGMTDAKFHNVPAVYIVALSAPSAAGFCPLQDTSEHGINVLGQLAAEMPDSVFLLDEKSDMPENLARARGILDAGRPIVLVLDPEGLAKGKLAPAPARPGPTATDASALSSAATIIDDLPARLDGKRVILLVGSEMAGHESAKSLIVQLADLLGAATIYGVNGANAVDGNNPFCYGYISFGGNDAALSIWNTLNADTVVISLGCDFDEYTTGIGRIECGEAWVFTRGVEDYGAVNGSYRHRFAGKCIEIIGNVEKNLLRLLECLRERPPATRRYAPAPTNLNATPPRRARPGFVDLFEFYGRLDKLWRPNSLGFDDVCMAYKDRQYVTQRPNPLCPFYSLYRGSAMGGAFGLGVGAKLGRPDKAVFVFTGDGCFRLISGCLIEARDLGLNLFVLDNQVYGIVQHGLRKILGDAPSERYHAGLARLDYSSIAAGHGWDHVLVESDLSNLEVVVDRCYRGGKSLLVELRVDPAEDLGQNPRLANLA